MTRGDSPKEEGEISDDDDRITTNSALGGGGSLMTHQGSGLSNPRYVPNKGNGKRKQNQRRRRNKLKETVAYTNVNYPIAEASNSDFCTMIKEYKDIRRKREVNQNDTKTLENLQQLYDEDNELMQLRMSALNSARFDTKAVNEVRNSGASSSQACSNSLVDNYDVVHMEMGSDYEDNNNGTGIQTNLSYDIDYLQEHIHHLEMKRQELTACQRQIEHQQNLLLDEHEKQPLISIIKHNLNSTNPILPLMSLQPYASAGKVTLLPDPVMRGPLLPKPALLPNPKNYSTLHQTPRIASPKYLMMPPLISINNPNSIQNFSSINPNAYKNTTVWGDCSNYSPKPIEVIDSGYGRESLPSSQSSDFHNISHSSSALVCSSTCSTMECNNNKTSIVFQAKPTKVKDPLYEDFEDDLHEPTQTEQKLCMPSLVVMDDFKSPSPSSILSLPHYDGLNMFVTNVKEEKDEPTVEVKEEVKIEDDNDLYLNNLKNKLLQDLHLRKDKKIIKTESSGDSNPEEFKVENESNDPLDSGEKNRFKMERLDEGEEEDFNDMIVIDSDHETVSPTLINLNASNHGAKRNNLFEFTDEKNKITSFSQASDDSIGEEMILRERLLKSLAARQTQQVTNQSTEYWGKVDLEPELSEVKSNMFQNYPHLFPYNFQAPPNYLTDPLTKKKKRNKKKKPKRKIQKLVVPKTPNVVIHSPKSSFNLKFKTNTTKSSASLNLAAKHGQQTMLRTVYNHSTKMPTSSSAFNKVKLLSAETAATNKLTEVKSIAISTSSEVTMPGASTAETDFKVNKSLGESPASVVGVAIQSSKSSAPRNLDRSHRIVTRGPTSDGRPLHSFSKYSKVPIKTKVNPMFPNCEPIVIRLTGNDESDDDSDKDNQSEKREEDNLDENISNKIESLLKEARKESSQPIVSTDNQSSDILPISLTANGSGHIKRSINPTESNKLNENNSGVLVKKSSLDKSVPIKRDKLENLNKEELKKREKELEVSLLTHKIKQLQDKSVKESKGLNDEKVKVSKMESILSRKRAELIATEGNVQKIKEQLEAVLKILNHNQLQVAEIEKMRETMRSQILEKERKTLKTSNEITECQEKLLMVTKSLKSTVNDNIMNINKQVSLPSKLTNSSSLKTRQQLKLKRKMSAHNNDADHPQVKRSVGVAKTVTHATSTSTISSTLSTTNSFNNNNAVDNKPASTLSPVDVVLNRGPEDPTDAAMTTTSNSMNADTISAQKSVRISLETNKNSSKACTFAKKSKVETRKMSPSVPRDEKLSKIKDAHRKSTLRNHQPMQTTTTGPILPGFSRAEKQLVFNPDFVKKSEDRTIKSCNPLKRKSEEQDNFMESKFIPDHLGGILKSVKAFRTENEFANPTYTNKLLHDVPLCHFELMGKCNDDNCPWQHERNYVMTPREVLMEIVSYHPSIIPHINENTPMSKYRALVGAYVDDFLANSKQTDRKNLYLVMLHQVSQAKGSAIFSSLNKERLWTIKQEKNKITKTKESANPEEEKDGQVSNHKFVTEICSELEDDALDSRYWMKGSNSERKSEDHNDDNEGEDSDGNNNDSQKIRESTFMKKAFSVLGLKSKVPKFDIALKVLAKGIELYPTSQALWHHYLKLFKLKQNHETSQNITSAVEGAKTPEEPLTERNVSQEDIATQLKEAYLHALNIIPSYKLHWQFIQACQSFSHKMESCGVTLEYLCSDKVDCKNKRVRSHRMLEVILHQMQTCFHTGKHNMGMDLIEDCLNSRDVYGLLFHMTKTDRIILWMFFLHLSIFHSLPSSLFSPSNDNAGRILNKTPFTIASNHQSTSTTAFSQHQNEADDKCSEILAWYDKASNECLKYLLESPPQHFDDDEDRQEHEKDEEEAWPWFSRLIISKANLLAQNNCCKDAINVLKDILNHKPGLHDVRIFLLNTIQCVGADDDGMSSDETFSSIIAHERGSFSAKMTYHIAKLFLSKDQSEEALQLLESLPIRIHDSNSGKEDPNILYCKLLDLELPEGFIPPPYARCFKKKVLENERVYFWLCYCLLLDLQGDYDGTEDSYNKAICRLRNVSDLCEIWLARLERLISSSGQSMAEEVQSEFFKLVNKSLTSLPVRLIPPMSEMGGKMYDSYDAHNSVINFCTQRMSSVDSLTTFYDWTLSIMPGNCQLAIEAINHFIRNNCRPLAKGFLIICLQETPRSLALWKTSLKLAFIEGNTDQMRADYKKSLDCLSYQKKLWKDFMLFEMVNGGDAKVEEIVGKCKQLGVNIVDLFKSLSAR